MKCETLIRVAAYSAATAIGAGAFGAHIARGQAVDWLHTGAIYQLTHAVAVVVVAPRNRVSAALMLAGATVFAFSLYVLALGAPRWFGAITPLGGVAMIGGWLWLALGSRSASVGTIDD